MNSQRSSQLPFFDTSYMGLDLSYAATGVCLIRDGEVTTWELAPVLPVDQKGLPRLGFFHDEILGYLRRYEPAVVALEGYAFGARSQAHKIGELGGVCRLALNTHRTPCFSVPPTALKKFITGKGTGDKSMVILNLYKRYDLDFESHNEADACVLAIMAMARWGGMDHLLSKPQREALSKIEMLIEKPVVRRRRRAVHPVASTC